MDKGLSLILDVSGVFPYLDPEYEFSYLGLNLSRQIPLNLIRIL